MIFQMLKLDLEKAEEPEIKLSTSAGSSKKQESFRKTSTYALLTMPKPLPIKFHLVKPMVFPVVMYGCESWDHKEG